MSDRPSSQFSQPQQPSSQPLSKQARTMLVDQVLRQLSTLDDARLQEVDLWLRNTTSSKRITQSAPTVASTAALGTSPNKSESSTNPFKQTSRIAGQTPSASTPMGRPYTFGEFSKTALPLPPLSVPSPVKHRMSRRSFLAGLITGGLLGGGAGGLAGTFLSTDDVRYWLFGRPPSGSIAAVPTVVSLPTSTPFPELPTDLLAQNEALQTQINDLLQERDGLRAQIGDLQLRLNDAEAQRIGLQEQLDTRTRERDEIQKLFDDFKAKNGDSGKQLDIYKRLEALDIDSIAATGLAAMAVSLGKLTAIRSVVKSGLQGIGTSLTALDAQMVEIDAGLNWLDREVTTLTASYRAFELALRQVGLSQASASTEQQIRTYAQDTANALPFTVGQEPRIALQAMGEVVAQLSGMLNNVYRLVINPSRVWVTSDQQGGLYALLITPLRNTLMAPVEQMLTHAESVEINYNSKIEQPVRQVIDQRKTVRAELSK